jgi:hypothetical protein
MGIGRAGWLALAGALVGWGAWLLTVLGVPPSAPGAQGVFYGSLLLALSATGAIVLAIASRRRSGRRAGRGIGFFVFDATFASLLLVFALWLQSLRMLTWPNALLVAGLFVLVERDYPAQWRRLARL